jgi:formate dehydrogenase iron-sulfur subunit
MGKKILIDLIKCRECSQCTADCFYTFHPGNNGIEALKELAAFSVSCRKCIKAPCIDICPASALEKTEDNFINRAVNLCIGCKSCVTICPFGTLLNDFFKSRKSICDYCDLNEEVTELLCVITCPVEALSLTDKEENPQENLYQVHDKVLIRDYKWENLVVIE